MNSRVKKLVIVIQDLVTKDKETVAVVSGDLHLATSDPKEKIPPVSFQMLLSDNKEFNRCIQDLVSQALSLHAEKQHAKDN